MTLVPVSRPATPAASKPSASTKIEASSNDPAQKIRKDGNRFVISGTALNNGFAPSRLELSIGQKQLSVPLSRGMGPMQTFEALEKALPPGYAMKNVRAVSTPGGAVSFEIVPGSGKPAPAPEPKPKTDGARTISASSNDPAQKIRKEAGTFVLSGTALNNGFAPSRLELTIGSKRISVPLSQGMTPMQTFRALEKALPSGYEMKGVRAARVPGGPVFFEIAPKGGSGKPGAARELESAADIEKSLRHRSLPSTNKVAKLMKRLDQQYADGNIMNGVAGTISGKIKVPAGGAKAADYTPWATRLVEASAKATDEEPLKGGVKVSVSKVSDSAINRAAKTFGAHGFVYDSSNAENFRPLAKDMSAAVKALGPAGDVELVTGKSKLLLPDNPSDRADKSWEVTLSLFVNKKTGEYAGFYSREGWV